MLRRDCYGCRRAHDVADCGGNGYGSSCQNAGHLLDSASGHRRQVRVAGRPCRNVGNIRDAVTCCRLGVYRQGGLVGADGSARRVERNRLDAANRNRHALRSRDGWVLIGGRSDCRGAGAHRRHQTCLRNGGNHRVRDSNAPTHARIARGTAVVVRAESSHLNGIVGGSRLDGWRRWSDRKGRNNRILEKPRAAYTQG